MTHDEIKNKAYLIWEADKRKNHLRCWFEAEEELRMLEHLTMKRLGVCWGQTDL